MQDRRSHRARPAPGGHIRTGATGPAAVGALAVVLLALTGGTHHPPFGGVCAATTGQDCVTGGGGCRPFEDAAEHRAGGNATSSGGIISADHRAATASHNHDAEGGQDGFCELYLARSSAPDGHWGVFTAVDLEEGAVVGEPDALVPMVDVTMSNDWSPWHDYVWNGGLIDSQLLQDQGEGSYSSGGNGNGGGISYVFFPGLGTHVPCRGSGFNIEHDNRPKVDNADLDPAVDPAVGSFSDLHSMTTTAMRPIPSGTELFVYCDGTEEEPVEPQDNGGRKPRRWRSESWLRENGTCMDNKLRVGTSGIPGAGRGAFAKSRVPAGSVVAPSPVLHLGRDSLPTYYGRGGGGGGRVVTHQLMLNYCLGHPDSSVLLFPTAPVVNFVNHDASSPNVEIRWSTAAAGGLHEGDRLALTPAELLSRDGIGLVIEYVALRDIAPGEEITIDYGRGWDEAWADHVAGWVSPQTIDGGFRREVGVPANFFPQQWMDLLEKNQLQSNVESTSGFHHPPLVSGELSPLMRRDNRMTVSDPIYRIGLPANLTAALRSYVDSRGITELARSLVESDPVEVGDVRDVQLGPYSNWAVQRPTMWHSNFHWIEPADESAHEEYLSALASGGFDSVLKSIGEMFDLRGLTCYTVSFQTLSHCWGEHYHLDFGRTHNKAFNILIPLYLASGEGTSPELLVRGSDGDFVAGLKYQHGVGTLIGDASSHSTAPCDYRESKEMRLMASINVADLTEEAVDGIMGSYSNVYYPPRGDRNHLLRQAGRHWGGGRTLVNSVMDANQPPPDVLMRLPELRPGAVSPLRWEEGSNDGSYLSGYMSRVGLSDHFMRTLRSYVDDTGITDLARSLVGSGRNTVDEGSIVEAMLKNDLHWDVQRPTKWKSDFHWIETFDEAAHRDFLSSLASGGFDEVLDAVGNFYKLDSLVVYHLSFQVLSHCWGTHFHFDFADTDGKAFNMQIPIYLGEESPPELQVRQNENRDLVSALKYEENVGVLIGDQSSHSTAPTNLYRTDEMRLMASIGMADVTEYNADKIINMMTNYMYPPRDETGRDHLLRQKGLHWVPGGGRSLAMPADTVIATS